ncbi:MAG TPA: integrase [Streptosporangiaceae bacterium]|nr:integrase [Streptosporangiaceae bacterium]
MRVTLATDPGTPGWPNEDFAAAAPGAAVLLDGATTFPRGADTGCVHGVAWYARSLGTTLLAAAVSCPRVPLQDALATAISAVRAQHDGTCDLTVPTTPAATVTALRAELSGVSYLVLSDSSIVADYGPGRPPAIITDTHQAAKASADAAANARTGMIALDGLRGLGLLSDGVTRIADLYELADWPTVLRLIREQGPGALIKQVREVEATDPHATRWPRSKATDDATVLWWEF